MATTYKYPNSGEVIKNVKSYYFITTAAKTGKETKRFMLMGITKDGKKKTVLTNEETAKKYGTPAKHVAKARPKKKTCEEKYDECVEKKAAKKTRKPKKALPRASPKEVEEEEESESSSSSSSVEEEEEVTPKKKSPSPKAAKGKAKRAKAGKGKAKKSSKK